jgi:hypothetical protein
MQIIGIRTKRCRRLALAMRSSHMGGRPEDLMRIRPMNIIEPKPRACLCVAKEGDKVARDLLFWQ